MSGWAADAVDDNDGGDVDDDVVAAADTGGVLCDSLRFGPVLHDKSKRPRAQAVKTLCIL